MKLLDKQKERFNQAQLSGLEQRMSLLMSFLEPSNPGKKAPTTQQNRFSAGQLTIVDLSDPFLDEGAACGLFDIMIRLFIRAEVNTGKVLVVDEAHKVSCDEIEAVDTTIDLDMWSHVFSICLLAKLLRVSQRLSFG